MASAATLTKQANENINLFIKLYTDKYGNAPVFNRHKHKWAYQDMIKDLGFDEAQATIRYYFDTNRFGHPVEHLLYNYDSINQTRIELDEDDEKRARLRMETEQRVREWLSANSRG